MAKAVLIVLLLVLLIVPAVLYGLSAHSTLAFESAPKAIGESTPVSVRISNPHGLRLIRARLEQNGTTLPLAEAAAPAHRLTFWRSHQGPREFQFIAGRSQAEALKEGKARLVIEAQANDLRGATDSIATDVDVIFRPPMLDFFCSYHKTHIQQKP